MNIVAFSGGIDSTALALTMPDATPIFTDTHWEFPELYQHIEKFERVTGRQVIRITHPDWPGGLPEYIRHSAFLPSHGARFCTRMFKIETQEKWLKGKLPSVLNIGLRADEPERIGNITKLSGLSIRYPLRELGYARLDCIRICVENDLLPRYPVYMARGGCMGCFYKRGNEVLAMNALIPKVVDELQEIEEGVQDERGKFFHMFPNMGMSIAEMRMQTSMFSPEDVYRDASNNSDVGIACGLFCNR